MLREAAAAAGRPMLTLSARVRIEPGAGPADPGDYALRGTPDEIRAGLAEWEALGVDHLAVYFASVTPEAIVRDVEWFVREIAAALARLTPRRGPTGRTRRWLGPLID